MITELAEIRCRYMWYIVMAWHFYVHTSVSSESLAEAVGSYLAVTRRRNINGALSTKHLVWSSKLRAFGLKGFGGEDGIMAYALNTHFQCSGPDGWHFTARRAKQKTLTAAEMRREVRLSSKPEWFYVYLLDLIATRRLRIIQFGLEMLTCKMLFNGSTHVNIPSSSRVNIPRSEGAFSD